ncbi:MAG: rRNA maturation RNase YbeY [Microcystaceae cyanobacterium]
MIKSVSFSEETLEVSVQYAESVKSGLDADIASISAQTWQNWLQTWLDTLTDTIPNHYAYALTLRLTDDAEIQQLNHQYRQKDQPTDVLAFATLDSDFPAISNEEPLYLGDIVISLDTAQRQARERAHSLKNEVLWLTSHGFLHLLGWDHPDEESLTRMLTDQKFLLKKLGFFIPLR